MMQEPQTIDDLLWKDFQPHQVYMWQQVSDVVMGDEWFEREKLFCQFLRPIPSVEELRDLTYRSSLSHFRSLSLA